MLALPARLLPVSAAEVGLGLALVLTLLLTLRGLRRVLRRECGAGNVLAIGGGNLLLAAGAALLAFELCWGLNHARLPLARSLGLETRGEVEEGREALTRVAFLVARAAARDAAQLGEERHARCALEPGGDPRLTRAWEHAARRWPVLGGDAPIVRQALASRLMTLGSLTGIYSPFTTEAHVNAELPTFWQPFVACHEIAHQRGFAREDEANFLGYLTATGSTDPALRYSGRLAALWYLLQHEIDGGMDLVEAMGPVVRADLWEYKRFWTRVQENSGAARTLTGVIERTNDAYLRGQGQEHGVASYGRMVELLLAHHRPGS